MESKLVIGCNICEKQLKEQYGYFIGQNGDYHLMFPINTSYTKRDLGELFLQNYTCPFCNEQLEITPNMMNWIVSSMDKNFHIQVKEGFIEFSNGEFSFAIPIEIENGITSVQNYLSQFGVILQNADEYLPTENDIKLIQKTIKEYDNTKWMIRIESGQAVEPFINTKNIWFDEI